MLRRECAEGGVVERAEVGREKCGLAERVVQRGPTGRGRGAFRGAREGKEESAADDRGEARVETR